MKNGTDYNSYMYIGVNKIIKSLSNTKKWQLLKDCWREKKRLDIWVLSSESISLMEV